MGKMILKRGIRKMIQAVGIYKKFPQILGFQMNFRVSY